MDFLIIFIVMFIASIGLIIYPQLKRTQLRTQFLKENNFELYMARHGFKDAPKCFKCNGTQIGITNGRNNSQMRTHYCRSCGTNLFYSKET